MHWIQLSNYALHISCTHSLSLICLSPLSLGPPQLLNTSAALVHIALTERDSITLPCPHVSVPAASVQWYNGSTLLTDDNDRVTLSSYGASISSVYFTDTGKYVCNVTNQYGSIKLSYNLSVYGEYICKVCLCVVSMMGIMYKNCRI